MKDKKYMESISTTHNSFSSTKHYYSTVNEIILTHSDLIIENNGYIEYVNVRFERPNNKGFDFAEIKIPNYYFEKTFGFSEDELLLLKRYLINNAPLILEYSQKGGWWD